MVPAFVNNYWGREREMVKVFGGIEIGSGQTVYDES